MYEHTFHVYIWKQLVLLCCPLLCSALFCKAHFSKCVFQLCAHPGRESYKSVTPLAHKHQQTSRIAIHSIGCACSIGGPGYPLTLRRSQPSCNISTRSAQQGIPMQPMGSYRCLSTNCKEESCLKGWSKRCSSSPAGRPRRHGHLY